MQKDPTAPEGPTPVRSTMPMPPRRRTSRRPDPRLLMIYQAVIEQGASYSPMALAEETGLPVDAIRRFAAQIVVDRNMVGLGMIEPEDAIRMASDALVASLRIIGMSHAETTAAKHRAQPLRAVDLMGLRRLEQRAAQDRRAVVPPRTPCPRCGAIARRQNSCGHQRVMTPAEAAQGLPHA